MSHLVLFGFAYPAERDKVPDWLMLDLLARLQDELGAPLPTKKLCQGTLLSGTQYLVALERWGYEGVQFGSDTITIDE
jgi:hypothetical protein